jgi:uncharacterized protein (DUF736 family)
MTGQTTDAVYKEAKRALDELADPSFQRHIIAELTEGKIDEVCREAKRALDELADPSFQRHIITELNEDEIRSWFDLTWRRGQPT